MRDLAPVTQRRAAEAAQARDQIERQKAANRRGAHPATSIDGTSQQAHQPRPVFETQPEPCEKGTDRVFHARMHEFSDVEKVIRPGGTPARTSLTPPARDSR